MYYLVYISQLLLTVSCRAASFKPLAVPAWPGQGQPNKKKKTAKKDAQMLTSNIVKKKLTIKNTRQLKLLGLDQCLALSTIRGRVLSIFFSGPWASHFFNKEFVKIEHKK